MARTTRRTTDSIELHPSLEGAPLHVERPGQITHYLTQFMQPQRLERLHQVLNRRTRRITALIEHINNPRNTAACLRSCDAFGIQDIHIVTDGAQPIRVALTVSKRAHRWVTVHHHPTLGSALESLHECGYKIIATDPGDEERQARAPEEIDLSDPICIAFGNEASGISDELRRGADAFMSIPMQGFVESLNISVAFAVTMYTLRSMRDDRLGSQGDLSDLEKVSILDTWLIDEVPRGERVLMELASRHSRAPENATLVGSFKSARETRPG